ncbi:MAG: ABC transporter substrate-binding protein, partial [Sphingobacteriales bacterium]|nr:ABC transporter substrate-binding protein [Sphingobacteriales bacterium]
MIKTVNILIGLSCLLLMFSCRKTADRQDNIIAQAIEVSDFRGKTISLNKPAERIVCLIESALSGLYMLGAENQVIGISTNVYTDKIFEQYSL